MCTPGQSGGRNRHPSEQGRQRRKLHLVDAERYSLFQTIDDKFPTGSTSSYTVRRRRKPAQRGGRHVWQRGPVVFAGRCQRPLRDAPLVAGQVLTVPSSTQSGPINSQTHKVYNEGDIVGSKLPNLVSPPPPGKGGCGAFLQILVIVVAIVVTVYTAGAAAGLFAPAAGAAGAAGAAAGPPPGLCDL